jgi:NET1-associated nuclear protein 1 (U3 small nucleolar RNA-associated protein 17)
MPTPKSPAAIFEQSIQKISKFDKVPASVKFSTDGRVLLVTSGNCVDVISVASGSKLAALEGHTQLVTDIALHPLHTSQAYTASLDGTLRLWDFSDGAPIQVLDLGRPVRQVVVLPDGASAYATLIPPNDARAAPRAESHVHRVDLASGRAARLFRCAGVARLALAAGGDPLLAVAGRDLLVWRDPAGAGAEDAAEENPARFPHARAAAAVAAHPDGAYVAVGDERGELFLWHNILAAGARRPAAAGDAMEEEGEGAGAAGLPFCSGAGGTMHWHAHAVRSLGFSPDGACLLSGGEEAVLVQWQVLFISDH